MHAGIRDDDSAFEWALRGGGGVFDAGEAADFEDEVCDDSDVDEEEKDSEKCGMVKELIDFEGDEARGGDHGEELGPAFAEEEADAFGEEESGINECAEAERAEFVRINVCELFEQKMQEVIVGINAERVHPMLRLGDEVLVGEHVDGDADGEKCEALEEFEGGDEHEAARVFASVGHSGWNIVAWVSTEKGAGGDCERYKKEKRPALRRKLSRVARPSQDHVVA